MAASRVQTSGKLVADGSSTLQHSFGSLPSVGSYVFVKASDFRDAGGSVNVTDNQGHTYQRVSSPDVSGGGDITAEFWYTKVATSSGTFTVTITNGGSSGNSYITGTFDEWTGLPATLTVSSNTMTSTTPTTSITTPTLTPPGDGVVFAVCGSNVAATQSSTMPGGAWSTDYDEPDGNAHTVGAAAYQVVSGGGGISAQFQFSPHSSANLTALIVYVGTGPTLTAAAGSYTVTGTAATLRRVTSFAASAGSYTVTGTAATLARLITIDDNFEGSSINVSGSSVSGYESSATVTLKPRVQTSEVSSETTRWLAPKARIKGVDGSRPTFVLSDYGSGTGKYWGHPWTSTRRMLFSYDGETWTHFDTAHTVGASTITFRHSTAFTQGTVYIAWTRTVTPTMVGDWIDDLESTYPTLIHDTPSSSGFVTDTFSAQTDELSRTVPAQPHYAFKISDASLTPSGGRPKRTMVLMAGAHAGEDNGNVVLMRAVEFLLTSDAQAQKVRQYFDVLVYPMLDAPGRAGGHWRGSFENGSGGEDDLNRHFHDVPAPIEIVDLPRTAMAADSPAIVQFAIDFHGQFADTFGSYVGITGEQDDYVDALEVYMGGGAVTQLTDDGSTLDTTTWFKLNRHTKWYFTIETGEPSPLTDSDLQDWGEAQIKAVADLLDADAIPGLYTLSCASGSYVVSGTVAALRVNRNALTAAAGAYTLTGTAATLKATRTLVCATVAYSFTGTAATLSAGAHTLSADPGSYVWTGTAAALRKTTISASDAGSYSWTGTAATLKATRTLVCATTAYTFTGTAAGLSSGTHTLSAAAGSYSWTGTAATLRKATIAAAAAGSYVVTGVTAALRRALRLSSASGAFSLTGTAATLSVTAASQGSILRTTSVLKTAPAAANGVTVTPSSSAWVNSSWVQVTASTATNIAIAAVQFVAAGDFAWIEVDVGVGGSGSEVVKGTHSFMMRSVTEQTTNQLVFPVPFEVPSGSSVSIRMRSSGTNTATWKWSYSYYELPAGGHVLTTTNVQKMLPAATWGQDITPNGTAWASGAWAAISTSAPANMILGGISLYIWNRTVPDFEIDIGVGGAGSETVVTTFRGAMRTFNFAEWGGTGYYIPLWPLLNNGLVSGSRISARIRKSDTSTNNWGVKLHYYETPLTGSSDVTTTKAQKCAPSAADSTAITTPASTGSFSAWTTLIASTATDIAITALVPRGNGGSGQNADSYWQIGLGGSGSEVTSGSFALRFGNGVGPTGDHLHIPLERALFVPAGTRVSIRAAASVNSDPVAIALTYIENPDCAQMTTAPQTAFGPFVTTTVAQLASATTIWASSNWTTMVASVSVDSVLTHVRNDSTDGAEYEVDLGVGASGSEVVIATVRGYHGTGEQGRLLRIPVPVYVAAGSRLSVRWRKSTTTNGTPGIMVFGYIDEGALAPAEELATALSIVLTTSSALADLDLASDLSIIISLVSDPPDVPTITDDLPLIGIFAPSIDFDVFAVRGRGWPVWATVVAAYNITKTR
jgi:hypothetical protein